MITSNNIENINKVPRTKIRRKYLSHLSISAEQEIETFDRSTDRPLEKLLVPFLTAVKKGEKINDTVKLQNEEINWESVKQT